MKKILSNRFYLSLFLLIVVYLVGIIAVIAGMADSLMQLTPYNLLFATAILLYNAVQINRTYLFWFALIAIAGYLLELAGITTGIIFGTYTYGSGLGFKLAEVPLIIGINWSVLVFSTAAILAKTAWSLPLKSAAAASMMVLYDVLLEPVAIRFDFWSWAGGPVPLQNYIAWWIIAFFMLLGMQGYVKKVSNKIAAPILIVQSVFFLILILKEKLNIFG
jgi:putative membrane protein